MAAQVVLRLINKKLTWALVRTCRILLEHLHTTELKKWTPTRIRHRSRKAPVEQANAAGFGHCSCWFAHKPVLNEPSLDYRLTCIPRKRQRRLLVHTCQLDSARERLGSVQRQCLDCEATFPR